MAYEIIWTENATIDFDEIINRISEAVSPEYAIKFVNEFYEKLELISIMPFIGVQSQKREGVRRYSPKSRYTFVLKCFNRKKSSSAYRAV